MSQHEQGHEEHAHATIATYVKVAILLGVITSIEIAIPYLPNRDPRWVFIALMVALSLIKFFYVVAFFMHLRYDTKFLSQQFVFAMVIAAGTFVALHAMSPAASPALIEARAAGTALPGDWRFDMAAHQAGAESLDMGGHDADGPTAKAGEATVPTAAAPQADDAAAAAAPAATAATSGAGDAAAGKSMFVNAGCTACHVVTGVPGAVGTVGPALDGLAARARDRIVGMTGDTYIRQSIEDPYAFVVDGYLKVMPPMRATMSDAQFEDLVAFLETL